MAVAIFDAVCSAGAARTVQASLTIAITRARRAARFSENDLTRSGRAACIGRFLARFRRIFGHDSRLLLHGATAPQRDDAHGCQGEAAENDPARERACHVNLPKDAGLACQLLASSSSSHRPKASTQPLFWSVGSAGGETARSSCRARTRDFKPKKP